jgi:hypothetical protein
LAWTRFSSRSTAGLSRRLKPFVPPSRKIRRHRSSSCTGTWNVAWGHPEFTDMGKLILTNKGTPSPEELALLERLVANPDFEPVFISPSRAQAVFRRRR